MHCRAPFVSSFCSWVEKYSVPPLEEAGGEAYGGYRIVPCTMAYCHCIVIHWVWGVRKEKGKRDTWPAKNKDGDTLTCQRLIQHPLDPHTTPQVHPTLQKCNRCRTGKKRLYCSLASAPPLTHSKDDTVTLKSPAMVHVIGDNRHSWQHHPRKDKCFQCHQGSKV